MNKVLLLRLNSEAVLRCQHCSSYVGVANAAVDSASTDVDASTATNVACIAIYRHRTCAVMTINNEYSTGGVVRISGEGLRENVVTDIHGSTSRQIKKQRERRLWPDFLFITLLKLLLLLEGGPFFS